MTVQPHLDPTQGLGSGRSYTTGAAPLGGL